MAAARQDTSMHFHIELAQQRAQDLRQEAAQRRLIREAQARKRRKFRFPSLLGHLRLA
ncbi:hypothetical protein Deide_11446 [Deinococcus deserti VCD115]|uniref:Transposase n=1 Tax=Deinococcus deserti (strain DSM 17065 / CIP 109153 / LMG 22923 / VCD115) TaxID=546414 RepID=X5HLE3_DEIDV|nr:hypothetical protein Deide_11446 [Deinococcus deserti VCD115]